MNKDIEKGLYDGGTTISKKMQAKINKQVHLIPFTDIEDKYVELYDEFNDENSKPNINANKDEFCKYWNENITEEKKIHIIIVYAHASYQSFAIKGSGGDVSISFKMTELDKLTFPPIDYIILNGCNFGDMSNTPNFAMTMADLTQGRNHVEEKQSFGESIAGNVKYKTYPTAVVAADGNTASPLQTVEGFVTGIKITNGKYAPGAEPHYTHYIIGKGLCVFQKGSTEKPTTIPGTPAEASVERSDEDWIEHPMSIEEILNQAKIIVQQ